METFFLYLIKSALWLSGFAAVYHLFLRNERYFFLKRIYLLSGILAAFIFPFISFKYQVVLHVPASIGDTVSAGATDMPGQGFGLLHVFMIIYLSGVLFLSVRLLWQLRYLLKLTGRQQTIQVGPARLVRDAGVASSFSFFNYIFIQSGVSNAEAEFITDHETAHIKQKHWLDLLLIELLLVLQWANPLVWVYSHYIKENHEYLADEKALQHTSDPASYKATLLNQLLNYRVICLTNSFAFSLNKKRFDMMKKTKRSPVRKMKLVFILPVFAMLFYAFAEPEYVIAREGEAANLLQDTTKEKPLLVLDGVIMVDFDYNTLVPNDILSINVLKGESAIAKYGDQGKHGVLEVNLKENTISGEKDPEVNIPDSKPAEEEVTRMSYGSIDGESTIFVVDGEITSEALFYAIEPGNIQKIEILKSKEATSAYGEDAKSVILITTKK